MHFSFVSLFPHLLESYFSDSILCRAIKNQKISVGYINPRDFSKNRFLKVDDYQVGGGAGLVLEPFALSDTLESIKNQDSKAHIIFLTPCGKNFNHKDSRRLAKLIELYANEVFSIGDFILTGGELAALCLCDSIARQINGVLGNSESLKGESYEDFLLEAPNFVKPHIFKNLSIPSEYSKGNHAKICDLKLKASEAKTRFHRLDLYWQYKQRLKNEK